MTDERSLPSRVGAEEIIDFTEKAAYHPSSSEESLRKRLKSPNKTSSSRRACRVLGLVSTDGDTIEPTRTGKEIAFEDRDRRREIMLKDVILNLDLYEIPLTRYVEREEPDGELLAEDLQRYWGVQVGLELSKDELSRAAATLLQLLEYCNLGNYVIGRRGNSTRLEFSDPGEATLANAIEELQGERRAKARDEHESEPAQRSVANQPESPEPEKPVGTGKAQQKPRTPSGAGSYQVHASDDESVIIWIQPSSESIEFLGAVHQMLETLHGNQPTPNSESPSDHSHQAHDEKVAGGDSEDD